MTPSREQVTHHSRMSIAESEAGVGKSWREASKATIVHWGQDAVHVGVSAL